MSIASRSRHILPGLALCLAVALAAVAVEKLEVVLLGGRWIEGLILAIGFGIAVRTALPHMPSMRVGIDFSAKILLEVAIVLLGASISLSAIRGAGLPLIGAIAGLVLLSIVISYAIGRLLGLPGKLATLIACGNAICGNSAIVAVAPVIEADAEEITAALAFTAVLGVFAVFLLPVLFVRAGLSPSQYGVLAGLTVYAVPQVLAATAPAGLLAIQTGTLVKLVRVLMLGPVIVMIGTMMKGVKTDLPAQHHSIVPWFIVGFVLMMGLRSFGLIPEVALLPMTFVANTLTVVAMAALGLSVDIRVVGHAGGRVIAAATLSLLVLGGLSWIVIAVLQIH
ncbi:YeiH family protein [Rhizobium tumorigenes]|uniref:YeiH family protein n=1 Tax=Rhizobium tumorigenes TaxID=2041385 RepID=UPI00241DA9B7|nr:putative sulfate exporter family transporter [Rhizobium tumorigenes]WFR99888.1 putative sulfate exporter family transporter [Rhizobium tumorigenes]